ELDKLEQSLIPSRVDIAVANAAGARFDAFVIAVTTVPAGATYPPLVTAAIRERLHDGGDRNVTHVLFVEIDTAGAENITRSGLFRQKVRFIGGLHASYFLQDVKGNKVLKAGTAASIRQVNYKLRTGRFNASGSADLYMAQAPERGWLKRLKGPAGP